MNISRNTLIAIVFLVVLLGGGIYYFFFFSSDTSSAVTGTSTEVSASELTFITLVGKLDPIVFDTSLLSDPRFTTRTDIRTTILPETSGRNDPFAPISGVAVTK